MSREIAQIGNIEIRCKEMIPFLTLPLSHTDARDASTLLRFILVIDKKLINFPQLYSS